MANLNARVSHLHATEEQWNSKPEFIPNDAELIINEADENYGTRFKIGDGITSIINLPFFISEIQINCIDGGEISTYPSVTDPPEIMEELDE